MFIKGAKPSFVKNSRGNKSIQVELTTYEGKFKCSAPSGKSKGIHEVQSYNKEGINKSLKLLKKFCDKIKNRNFIIKKLDDLKQLSSLVKKFENNFGELGGNVLYSLEGVFLKAASADNKKEVWKFINDDVNNGKKPKMPMPVGNCVGGGLHNKLLKGKRPDIQEFLFIPNEKSYSRAVTLNFRAYESVGRILRKKHKTWKNKKGDEGTWMTSFNNEEVLEIMKNTAGEYGLRIGVDIAGSSFYENGYYKYKNKNLIRDKIDQADYVERLSKKFGIFYIEDPIQEDDFSGFKEILNNVSKKVLIVGDDLTTTNLKRVHRAVRGGAINAMIIKPNQIGSILEVKKVVEYCKKHKIKMIFSHRSGETMDDILADYCVGFGGNFLKAGIFGKERLIKLKRVMDIEKSLN